MQKKDQIIWNILQNWSFYHNLWSTTWAKEKKKKLRKIIEKKKMLSYSLFVQKAARLMLKTGLFGQFEQLKRVFIKLLYSIEIKNRIKPKYRVEDEIILLGFSNHKITFLRKRANTKVFAKRLFKLYDNCKYTLISSISAPIADKVD